MSRPSEALGLALVVPFGVWRFRENRILISFWGWLGMCGSPAILASMVTWTQEAFVLCLSSLGYSDHTYIVFCPGWCTFIPPNKNNFIVFPVKNMMLKKKNSNVENVKKTSPRTLGRVGLHFYFKKIRKKYEFGYIYLKENLEECMSNINSDYIWEMECGKRVYFSLCTLVCCLNFLG